MSEAVAQRHFADQNPVGRSLSASLNGRRQELEIIGLVRTQKSPVSARHPRRRSTSRPPDETRHPNHGVGSCGEPDWSSVIIDSANTSTDVSWLSDRGPRSFDSGRRHDRAGADDGGTGGRIRAARVGTCVHRYLRAARLQRFAANERDWHPYGAWCAGTTRYRIGRHQWNTARHGRRRRRPARGVGRVSVDRVIAVWAFSRSTLSSSQRRSWWCYWRRNWQRTCPRGAPHVSIRSKRCVTNETHPAAREIPRTAGCRRVRSVALRRVGSHQP